MRHSILYLFFLALIGCKTQKDISKVPERVIPTNENVDFLRKESLSGYLYEYKQEKCPGTYSSAEPDKCTRILTVFSKNRLENSASLFENDTVTVTADKYIVLDSQKFEYILPVYVFGEIKIREMFPNERSYQESKGYESHYYLKLVKDNDICSTEQYKKVRITECVITKKNNALVFSASNDLLEYALSPSVSLTNFGMPVNLLSTTSKIVWLVPEHSPILKKLSLD